MDGGPGTVGVIASVTRPFCGDCDRVRLTADGQVRNCLFAREESDLRAALRAGADDEELASRWRAAMMTKRPGHGIDDARSSSPRGRCPRSAADPPSPPARCHRNPPVPQGTPRPASTLSLLARPHAGSHARRGTRSAARGAPRTPATSCDAPACAAWGCSSAAPRRRPPGRPWRNSSSRSPSPTSVPSVRSDLSGVLGVLVAGRSRPCREPRRRTGVARRGTRRPAVRRRAKRCRTTTGEVVRHRLRMRTRTGDGVLAAQSLARRPRKLHDPSAGRAAGSRQPVPRY